MVMENPLGVITLLWTEDFGKKDLWIFDKVRQMGFQAVDIAV